MLLTARRRQILGWIQGPYRYICMYYVYQRGTDSKLGVTYTSYSRVVPCGKLRAVVICQQA